MPELRLTEEQWKQQVLQMAVLFGWLAHHDRPARTKDGWRTAIEGDAGFPDLCLAREGRVIFAELKSDDPRSKPSPEQQTWLHHLAGPGQEAYVWRPRDRPAVEAALR